MKLLENGRDKIVIELTLEDDKKITISITEEDMCAVLWDDKTNPPTKLSSFGNYWLEVFEDALEEEEPNAT